MIETSAGTFHSGPIVLLGESANAYALASDLIALDQVWRVMNKAQSTLEDAFKAYNEARESYDVAERAHNSLWPATDRLSDMADYGSSPLEDAREKLTRVVDMSNSVEFMWKTILRMREIRGVDAPILVPTCDLRAAIVDILRLEVQAFDAAIEQANDPNA